MRVLVVKITRNYISGIGNNLAIIVITRKFRLINVDIQTMSASQWRIYGSMQPTKQQPTCNLHCNLLAVKQSDCSVKRNLKLWNVEDSGLHRLLGLYKSTATDSSCLLTKTKQITFVSELHENAHQLRYLCPARNLFCKLDFFLYRECICQKRSKLTYTHSQTQNNYL